jgi:hypothetical protein
MQTNQRENKLELLLENWNKTTDNAQKERLLSYSIKDFAETLARNHFNLIHRSGGVYEWVGGNGKYVIKTTEELFRMYIKNELE